ncbi:proteoglycan 4b [Centropristis striata]|uniref:proteoglycan 4b n=1 Tax=Centropristis striata TaxID=184440 RepID=UPI0027E18808|nr:proteoglycan 4b [Centropristis striata]
MTSTILCAVILLVCALTLSAAQTSCKGRCGAEYYRGYMCQCDYGCLLYGECCKDFEAQCTTKNSCKGRCGEGFKRGRLCSCDSDCIKYKQCCTDYKMHCDAEEPTVIEATPSTFSEGNDADDNLIPLVTPTSYPQDDLSDDMNSQVFPKDEFSNNEDGQLEASPIPESTSGYGSSTADLLDQMSAEPTQDPDALEFSKETSTVLPQTQTTLSDDATTQAKDNPSTLYPPFTEEAPTESTDASDASSSSDTGTTLPQPTTSADHVSSQPTSAAQTEHPPRGDTPETGGVEQIEDVAVAFSDEPEVATLPSNTASSAAPIATRPPQESSTVLENSQVTTITASMMNLKPIPEKTTENPEPDVTENSSDTVTTSPPSPLEDLQDPSVSDSPAGMELTTHSPSSTDAVQDDVTAGETTADTLNVTPDPTKPTAPEATSKPQDKPDPYEPLPATPTPAKPTPAKPTPAKPSSKPEAIEDTRDYQADDNNDTNLCSGRPVSGVTTLRNGTMVVFRGHYFWVLDRNMVAGPARGITQVWGIPSPIDTVFTRCNCQGKTYIFKGSQYWRFENDVLDPSYPKVVETGFDGLRGHITAALSVPQYQSRREAVYFFKRGGLVQKYSYQSGTSPTCRRKVQYAVYTIRNRMVRQAVSTLGPAVNIRTSWRGFPTTITAAVSVPNNREPEGYKYYVFSRSKSYNVRMNGERPVVAPPPPPSVNTSPQSNNFFKCSKNI